MPYIGNTPAEKYAAFNVQHFTTSATTSYTLTHAVANELDIRLVLNNVVQQPGASYAYTASATTLTLSVATTGTDTMYAVYIGKAVQTVTPGANSVGPTALQDNSVTNAKLADATQGDVIYYGAAGAPAQLSAGTSGYFLKTQGAGANPVWAADTDTVTTTRENVNPVLINGSMEVAQRNGSVSGIGNGDTGYHTCDRWRYEEGGSPTQEWTQSQDEIDSSDGGDAWANGFIRQLKMDCTTASGSLAAGDYEVIEQRIEKQDCNIFKKGTSNSEKYTLTFWIKASKTGINIVELRDHSYSRSCSQSYTINVANTYEKKTVVFAADATGGFTPNAQLGLSARWYLNAGTNYQSGSLQTTWGSTTAANQAVGQVNQADSTANVWNLTGAQLEAGEYTASTVPPFQSNTYGASENRCQRYYFKTWYVANMPYASGVANGTTNARALLIYPQTMRSNPSMGTSGNTDFKVYCGATNVTTTNVAFYYGYRKQVLLYADVASGLTNGQGAVIIDSSGSSFITGDSEL